MQIKRDRSFPYPILGKNYDDYLSSKFGVEIIVNSSKKELNVELNVELTNPDLIKLINQKKASVFCHLECPKTKYRSIVELSSLKNKIKIENGLLNGYLELAPVIIATQNIPNYFSSYFNKDYNNLSFNIEKGNVLGIAEQFKIPIKKDLGDLSKIPSIFNIVGDEKINKIEVDIYDEKITIKLPLEVHKIYKQFKGNSQYNEIFISTIILPSLMHVLSEIKSGSGGVMNQSMEDFRWFRVIKKKLTELNLDIEDSYDLLFFAQEILDMPVTRAVESLEKIGVNEE